MQFVFCADVCHHVGFTGQNTGVSRRLTGQSSGKRSNDETFSFQLRLLFASKVIMTETFWIFTGQTSGEFVVHLWRTFYGRQIFSYGIVTGLTMWYLYSWIDRGKRAQYYWLCQLVCFSILILTMAPTSFSSISFGLCWLFQMQHMLLDLSQKIVKNYFTKLKHTKLKWIKFSAQHVWLLAHFRDKEIR